MSDILEVKCPWPFLNEYILYYIIDLSILLFATGFSTMCIIYIIYYIIYIIYIIYPHPAGLPSITHHPSSMEPMVYNNN